MTFMPGWAPKSPNQVVSESFGDGAFIEAVAKVHGVPPFDFTAPRGEDGRPLGKGGFKKHLSGMRLWVDRRVVTRLVIVGDNDDDHAKSYAAITRSIKEVGGYPTPKPAPLQIADNGSVRVGVIMLPEAGKSGCMETLLMQSTLKRPELVQCLTEWETCCAFPKQPQNAYDKFRVHSLLAASIRKTPTLTIVKIWDQPENPFDPAAPEFKWIADFLKSVFA